jgi:hypothetical protein
MPASVVKLWRDFIQAEDETARIEAKRSQQKTTNNG